MMCHFEKNHGQPKKINLKRNNFQINWFIHNQSFFISETFQIYLFSFVETPRKFIIADLSIRKLGSSSVLTSSNLQSSNLRIFISISTDEDPSLRIESSAMINLRGVSTKLNKYIVFAMQTYKKLITFEIYNFLHFKI